MKTISGLGVACIAMMATPLQAATTITLVNGSASFGATITSSGAFEHQYDFVSPLGLANASVITILLPANGGERDIDFSSIDLDGTAFTELLNDNDGAEVWKLTPAITLPAGNHVITLKGTAYTVGDQGASYSGTVNVSEVPEPESWMMMIGGFALLGFAMRRHTRLKMRYC